ncbi:MAG: hypothetical protein OEW68_02625 [Gammaproteobacteria bacterium]|nr:hypothetical protein [Gammaproteobacteria bacterium]MDH4313720.1 hypothetical protein [Gammaproteobacteria bacterium]MDH5212964.1 hypothetical protein [Gammaproteobacteria bacterium]MDH5500822.1 hypothetical protein [Gammaproteobacteria bacterium]
MKTFRTSPTVSCLLAACLVLAFAPVNGAMAEKGGNQGGRVLLAQGGGMTLDQAVEQVRRQYNGRIVSAETRVKGNREVHYIKVLTEDGKVKTVQVNGRTLENG